MLIKQRYKYIIFYAFLCSLLISMANPAPHVSARISKTKNVSVLLIGNNMVSRKGNDTVKYLYNLAKGAGRKMTVQYVAHADEKIFLK